MPRRQILCLSGGGYAGLFAAKFLSLLEQQMPAGSRIGNCFDAVAGTSIGGLIGLALANGSSAQEILAVMLKSGTAVFPRKRGGMARAIWGPKHSVEPLRLHAKKLLRDKKLGGLAKPVVIPSVALSTGRPKIFRAVPGRTDPDSSAALLDVALATSAAPLYFPPHKIGNDLYADGGLIANRPDHLAILDALNLYGWAPEELWILSIGTTYTPPGILTHSTARFGLMEWVVRDRKLLAVSMHAQMELAHHCATQLLPAGRLLRIDPPLSPAQADAIALDIADVQATSTLQALAQSSIDALDSGQRRLFLNHSARQI